MGLGSEKMERRVLSIYRSCLLLLLSSLVFTACGSANKRSRDEKPKAEVVADLDKNQSQNLFIAYSSQVQQRLDKTMDEQFFSGVNPAISQARIELQRIQKQFQVEWESSPDEASNSALDASEALRNLLQELTDDLSLDQQDRDFFRGLGTKLDREIQGL
jgi:hypothetical protein